MSEIKNGGLDQYGTEPFKQQQFGTAGVERVNTSSWLRMVDNEANYFEPSKRGFIVRNKPHG